ncbi:MAG: hypothetical protein F2667_04390, partial [Actinobacteria bacterium]|nr:hypothetical protein [Actinomycetota bacterium]
MGLRDVGVAVSVPELGRLVRILMADPSSAVYAAMAGWAYPIDRTALAVLDLFDLTALANSDPKRRP